MLLYHIATCFQRGEIHYRVLGIMLLLFLSLTGNLGCQRHYYVVLYPLDCVCHCGSAKFVSWKQICSPGKRVDKIYCCVIIISEHKTTDEGLCKKVCGETHCMWNISLLFNKLTYRRLPAMLDRTDRHIVLVAPGNNEVFLIIGIQL